MPMCCVVCCAACVCVSTSGNTASVHTCNTSTHQTRQPPQTQQKRKRQQAQRYRRGGRRWEWGNAAPNCSVHAHIPMHFTAAASAGMRMCVRVAYARAFRCSPLRHLRTPRCTSTWRKRVQRDATALLWAMCRLRHCAFHRSGRHCRRHRTARHHTTPTCRTAAETGQKPAGGEKGNRGEGQKAATTNTRDRAIHSPNTMTAGRHGQEGVAGDGSRESPQPHRRAHDAETHTGRNNTGKRRRQTPGGKTKQRVCSMRR